MIYLTKYHILHGIRSFSILHISVVRSYDRSYTITNRFLLCFNIYDAILYISMMQWDGDRSIIIYNIDSITIILSTLYVEYVKYMNNYRNKKQNYSHFILIGRTFIHPYLHNFNSPWGSLSQSASTLSSPIMCILQFAIICSVILANNDVILSDVL